MLTGQPAIPFERCFSLYIFLAEYIHSGSAGHERQFVAEPAAFGLRSRRKLVRLPVELIDLGRCVPTSFPLVDEQSSHIIKSMSAMKFSSTLQTTIPE